MGVSQRDVADFDSFFLSFFRPLAQSWVSDFQLSPERSNMKAVQLSPGRAALLGGRLRDDSADSDAVSVVEGAALRVAAAMPRAIALHCAARVDADTVFLTDEKEVRRNGIALKIDASGKTAVFDFVSVKK